MNTRDILYRLKEMRERISGGDEQFDKERIAAMKFAENAIVSAPITCENIYFDEYGVAHDRKMEKPQTNADKIRAMSDEELANLLAHKFDACHNCSTDSVDTCIDCWLEWLKQEADDGEG